MVALDQILRFPLAPILIAQALWVRTKATRLPEPSGPREGAMGDGPPLSLLITGDSSAAGVGCTHQEKALSGQLVERLAHHFQVTWRVEAKTGDRTRDTIERLEALPVQNFDVVVTALGVNDATGLASPKQFLADQRALLDLLRRKFSAKLILMSGVPPMQNFPALPQPLAWALGCHASRLDNAMARAASGNAKARHLRFDLPLAPELSATDGYHPNAAAYELWAENLSSRITAEWPSLRAKA